jgi:LacI family transcriptional regulator
MSIVIHSKHVLMLLGSYDQSAHEGIAEYAGQHGWHLNVSILKEFKLPKRWQGDGIIASLNHNKSLVAFVKKARVPVVDLSIWRDDIELPRVVADNSAIGQLGAEHFLNMGHQHYAWFALTNDPVGQKRYIAYSDRLAKANLACIRLDTAHLKDPVHMAKRLKKLPKPCAIYTKSDNDAAWLFNVCMDTNLRVPEEIAILGTDDNRLICENQAVPLSSVRHDLKTIGYEGAIMLGKLMSGQKLNKTLKLIPPSGITIRKSTNALAVTDPLIRKLLKYLQTHFRRSIGTTEIAEVFSVSRRNLEKRFRKSMHCSLHDYLIKIRINEAKRLLQYTSEPIETIAALTGFCHAPHFSNTFKKKIGIPPSHFRNQ